MPARFRSLPPGPRGDFPGQTLLAFRREPLKFLARVAGEYGDVVSWAVGPLRYVLLAHPDHVHDVLVAHADRFTKGPALRKAKITLGEGLLTSEGDFHRRQRRLSQPAFHPNRVTSYARMMVDYADELTATWRDGQALDVHDEMMRLTLSVVAMALFGADVRAEAREIGEAMTVSVKMFNRALLPFAEVLGKLPLPSNFRFLRAQRRLDATIYRFISERRRDRAAGQDRDDLLSRLLAATDPETIERGQAMSDQQLRDEMVTLFSAGHETTANALAWTWHLLSRHHDVEAKLHEELDDVLGDRAPIPEILPKLTYTRMVLAESMRVYPPVWAIGRQAKIDYPIAGTPYVAPVGSVLLMSQWVTHRDARWFPEPLRFDPQRWRDEPRSRAGLPRYAYFPFGGGPRSCVGEPFAWMEGVLLLAAIARRWRFRPVAGAPPVLPQALITLRPRHGAHLRACRR